MRTLVQLLLDVLLSLSMVAAFAEVGGAKGGGGA